MNETTSGVERANLQRQVDDLAAKVEENSKKDNKFLITTMIAAAGVGVAILALLFSGRTGPVGPKGSDGAPVGTVVAWPGKTPPDDTWMICDGRALKSKDHRGLYETIGTQYGTGSTEPDMDFNIPNYQGYFLRGFDPKRAKDPGPREPSAVVGSTQADAVAGFVYINTPPLVLAEDDDMKFGIMPGMTYGTGNQRRVDTSFPDKTHLNAGRRPETRPVNRAVLWIIKVK